MVRRCSLFSTLRKISDYCIVFSVQGVSRLKGSGSIAELKVQLELCNGSV